MRSSRELLDTFLYHLETQHFHFLASALPSVALAHLNPLGEERELVESLECVSIGASLAIPTDKEDHLGTPCKMPDAQFAEASHSKKKSSKSKKVGHPLPTNVGLGGTGERTIQD